MSVRLLPVLGIVTVMAVLTGACARMGAPRGGPEDRIPPMVVSTVPDTFAVIEPTRDPVKIRFSERISERAVTGVLDDAVQVSPTTSDVRVKHNRDGLEVSLLDGFEAGTVYRISVLPLIRDRFGNPMPDVFEFFFSTGPDFEANVVAGVVTDRLTGAPVESIRVDAVPAVDATAADVAAPTEEEEAPTEEDEAPPAYTSLTDSLGIFAIRYLPTARYRLVAFEDQNRNGVADFRERQDEQAALIVGPADTLMPLNFDLLQPDTTPARLGRIETLDSLFLRVTFDDYLDPGDEFRTVALRFEKAEGFEETEGEVPLQERVLQEHLYPAYQDSLNAWADSVAAVRADSIAAARADSLAAAGIDPEALDTTAVDTTTIDPEAAEAGPEAPPEIPQEVLDEPEEPLPQQSLVVALRRPMLPRVVYQVTVTGVVNIARLGDGGGEAAAVWEPPEEEVSDTAAAQPDTAAAQPDTATAPPDTATAPPDTTTAPP
ncbi:MAG: Ig-like domain-containing protein, partial [Gemmatimonadetes bacterium]|nr:Ig-like domain-containing protein [Gemmatimonadota bacterium]